MIKTVIEVGGMQCGMCEAHVNDAIRKAFPEAKKVASSHRKGCTEILSAEPLDEDALRRAVADSGYIPGETRREEAAKKRSLFGRKST